jgi:hypothetical protein
MFGVLIVVLCRNRIAILSFSTGQHQISLVAYLQVLKAIWLGSGRGRYPVLLAELQTGALAQLSSCCLSFLAL